MATSDVSPAMESNKYLERSANVQSWRLLPSLVRCNIVESTGGLSVYTPADMKALLCGNRKLRKSEASIIFYFLLGELI